MKRFGVILCILSVSSAILTSVSLAVVCLNGKASEDRVEGRFFVRVVELSGNPVSGAVVYIPQTDEAYKTGADGYTAEMYGLFSAESKWGTLTLCVFREGFVDYVLYDCVVYCNRVRKGPTIRLFRAEEDAPDITVYSENPPDEYSKELMKKAKRKVAEKSP